MKLLANKKALITGGSDGIGFAIAIAFAKHGASLVIIGRDEQKLIQRKKHLMQYNVDILCIAEDITNKEAIPEIRKQIGWENIQIDILVNKDIANISVFLASNQAKWITGGIFPVDGGLTTN